MSRSKSRSRRPRPAREQIVVFEAESHPPPIPYDEHLLERARTQWQFGDWESLVRMDPESLQHHPERGKLALLAAAGHHQRNNSGAARQFIRLAHDWGCPKALMGRILVAGVYNSLARAAAASGQEARALMHFQASLQTGTPGAEARLFMPGRVGGELAQLGLPAPASLDTNPAAQRLTEPGADVLSFTPLASLVLGEGWAANTVNTAIFRHHGVLTAGGFQFTAFYADAHTVRFARRHLADDSIETFDLKGSFNLLDAHNGINLGCDRRGHVHVAYDHHGTRLRYRRSTRPHDIAAWTDELPMTGAHEAALTYPCFILPPHGAPLMLLYRDGHSSRGTARIKTYDEANETWSDRPVPVLSGAGHEPWTSNPYWNHPAVGRDGSLHLSFVWRTHSLGEEERVNNINVGYACSHDGGRSWFTSHGRPYRLPITQVNAETVHAVSPGSNLINQCSMAVDSHERPHIVFYADDTDGIPQYQHTWFDGRRWTHQVISRRENAFALAGRGTLRVPISRPEIVIDRDDHAYVLFRGDLSGHRMSAIRLAAPDYRYGGQAPTPLWPEDLGFAEPVIDRTRWERDNVLTFLHQHADQPDGDGRAWASYRPVTLQDVRFP